MQLERESSLRESEESQHWISAAEVQEKPDQESEKDESSNDFEFPLLVTDQIISNGKVRSIYPLFNRDIPSRGVGDAEDGNTIWIPIRRLMIEDREVCTRSGSTSSSSSIDDLDGITPVSYCARMPQSVPATPDRCKKSRSTGSTLRRWRLRDLMVGRSLSDGQKKFVFLDAKDQGSPTQAAAAGRKAKHVKDTEMGIVTAPRAVLRERLWRAVGFFL